MTDDTSARRRTRRTGSTRTVPRVMGPPITGPRLLYTPLTPDELAWMIAEAREQRTAEDNAADARKRTA